MIENSEQLSRLSTTPPVSSAEPTAISARMKCYDLKNWRRVKPHLADKGINDILVRDFNSSPLADGAGSLITETCPVNSNPAIGT
jgi:hypothetical protein